jgi:hypothetical protein
MVYLEDKRSAWGLTLKNQVRLWDSKSLGIKARHNKLHLLRYETF